MTHLAPRMEDCQYLVLGQLAEEIKAQLAAGEQPDVERLVGRHPEVAEEIRQLVPVLSVMQQLGEESQPQGRESPRVAKDGPDSLGRLGDFRLRGELGRGGMGVVYEAEQVSLGRRVALKVLPFAATMDARQLQRFKNEAMAAACLDHPHIVDVYGVGCERGVHYYAMRLIEGQTVAEVVAQLRQQAQQEGVLDSLAQPQAKHPDLSFSPPSMPEATEAYQVSAGKTRPEEQALASTRKSRFSVKYFREVAQLGMDVAEALDHAHAHGVIHRDIKPSNLIVDAQGKVWVTDFGLALVESQGSLTLTGDLVGTWRYMSPEQTLAKRVPLDHRTDIYSLGATLYELLTLQPTFPGENRQELMRQISFEEPRAPRKLSRSIPVELDTIVLKALEKNANDRYATAQDMAEDLRRFLGDEPIRARRPSLLGRARKWTRRHRRMVSSAAVVGVLALLSLLVGGWWHNVRLNETLRDKDHALEEARRQQRLADRFLYTARINSARFALQVGNVQQVREELDRCVPSQQEPLRADLRGWEWHFLQSSSRGAVFTLAAEGWNGSPAGQYWVSGFAWSPDGQYLAAAFLSRVQGKEPGWKPEGSSLRIWDALDGRPLATLERPESLISHLAWDPNSQRIAFSCQEGTLEIWDLHLKRGITAWKIPSCREHRLAWSPDGKRLSWAGNDGTLAIWDTVHWDQQFHWQRKVHPRGGHVYSLSWSPEATRLALTTYWREPDGSSGAPMKRVVVWDTTRWRQIYEVPFEGPNPTGSSDRGQYISWSANQGKLATINQGGVIKVHDGQTGKEILTLRASDSVHSLAWSPGGQRLAATLTNDTIQIWYFRNGQVPSAFTLTGHLDQTNWVAWSPDGLALASASRDHTIRVWDILEGSSRLVLKGHTGSVWSVAWAAEGRRLASVSRDGTVKVWDGLRPTGVYHITSCDQVPPRDNSVAWSPDSTRLALVQVDAENVNTNPYPRPKGDLGSPRTNHFILRQYEERHIRVLDPTNYREYARFPTALVSEPIRRPNRGGRGATISPGRYGVAWVLSWSPDGRYLASAGSIIAIWDSGTGEEHVLLGSLDEPVAAHCLAWSPDGQYLAVGGRMARKDACFQIWAVSSRRERFTRTEETGTVLSIAWNREGKRLASVIRKQERPGGLSVSVWDAESMKILYTLPVGQYRNTPDSHHLVAWSPDDKRLAAITEVSQITIWNGANGKRLGTLSGPTQGVTAVAWSPDGKRLASIGRDNIAKVWDAESYTELLSLRVQDQATEVTWSPDGTRLSAFSTRSGHLTIWDPSRERIQQRHRAFFRNALAQFYLTSSHAKERKVALAQDLVRKALFDRPDDPAIWETLGKAHYQAGEWKASLAAFQKAIHFQDGRFALLANRFYLAIVYWRLGRFDEARFWYVLARRWLEESEQELARVENYRIARELHRLHAEADAMIERGSVIASATMLTVACSFQGRSWNTMSLALCATTTSQAHAGKMPPLDPKGRILSKGMLISSTPDWPSVYDFPGPWTTQRNITTSVQWGRNLPSALTRKKDLADLYRIQGRYAQAESLYEEVLKELTEQLGPKAYRTLICKHELATVFRNQRKYAEAEPLLEDLLRGFTEKLGSSTKRTLGCKNDLAIVYQAQGKFDLAEAHFTEVLQGFSDEWGINDRNTLTLKGNLAKLYLAQGKFAQAEPLCREALEGMRRRRTRKLRLDDRLAQGLLINLIACYSSMGQHAKAEPLLRELATFCKQKMGADSSPYGYLLVQLGANLLHQNKPVEAEPLLRQALSIYEQKKLDALSISYIRSLLGASLLGQKNYAEAEPLLVQAYQGLYQRQASIPTQVRSQRLTEALQRLVLLYESWDKPEQAKQWREKLASLQQTQKKTEKPTQK
jgi:WD40 repeat protein/serine/threonine protein kinase/Flp pilus assembly protein TadD